jgi:hypothetical protein
MYCFEEANVDWLLWQDEKAAPEFGLNDIR